MNDQRGQPLPVNYLLDNSTEQDERLYLQMADLAPRSELFGYNAHNDVVRRDTFSLLYKVEPEMVQRAPDGAENHLEALHRMEKSGVLDTLRERTRLNPLYAYVVSKDVSAQLAFMARQISNPKTDLGGVAPGTLEKVQDAEQLLDGAAEAMDLLAGGNHAGNHTYEGEPLDLTNTGLAMQLMQALNTKATVRFVEEMGRLRTIMRQARKRRVSIRPRQMTGIETGGELSRLVPSSLGLAGNPLTLPLFGKGLHERGHTQYDLKTPEVDAKGPIIILVDKSDSMEGEKDIYATALALVIQDIAREEKRDFWVIPFDGGPRTTYHFPKGQPDPAQFLRLFAESPSGGTVGKLALDVAFKIIREDPVAAKADILMITDGFCQMTGVAPEIRAEVAALKTRLWVALVQYPNEAEALAVTDPEYVLRIDSLRDEKTEREVLGRIAEM